MSSIPIFSTYVKRENQLSHALAITLDRSAAFKREFLKNVSSAFTSKFLKQPDRASISVQSFFGGSGLDLDQEGEKALPDILLLWEEDEERVGLVVEVKVEAPWDEQQARRHVRLAKYSLTSVIGGVAITVPGVLAHQIPKDWISITWEQIYALATEVYGRDGKNEGQFWAGELAKALEITEAKLMGKGTLNGTLTKWAGISFAKQETSFSFPEARRIGRLLITELKEHRALDEMNISVSIPKQISKDEGNAIWHAADRLAIFDSLVSKTQITPHLNFTISDTALRVGLTFPNSSFSKTLQRVFRNISEEELLEEFKMLSSELLACTRLPTGSAPYFYIMQQHFASQKAAPHVDGSVRIDLRTIDGYKKGKLNIKSYPLWLSAVKTLVEEKPAANSPHLQAGFGNEFAYAPDNEAFFLSPELVIHDLIATWQVLHEFGKRVVKNAG